jgi:hypothetical protein
MGTTVLDAGASPSPSLYLYAHCLRGKPGGVALLAINADRNAAQTINLPAKSVRYSLTSNDLMSPTVMLNGVELQLTPNGDLPSLDGAPQAAGPISLSATSIAFFAIPEAHNAACR